MEENNNEAKNTVLKPEGRTSFDDLKEIKAIVPHKIDHFKFTEQVVQPDFYHHTKVIPKPRVSGEE